MTEPSPTGRLGSSELPLNRLRGKSWFTNPSAITALELDLSDLEIRWWLDFWRCQGPREERTRRAFDRAWMDEAAAISPVAWDLIIKHRQIPTTPMQEAILWAKRQGMI